MTNQQKTFDALNGKYQNSETGKINEVYLNEQLHILIQNEKELYADLRNKRVKPTALAWRALWTEANSCLKLEEYPKEYTASSEQLKKWLNTFGRGYDSIAETVEYVTEERKGE